MTKRRTVYSTQHGRMCPDCRRPIGQCSCRSAKKQEKPKGGDGIVRVSRETKGRKGKGVTIISGLPLNHNELKALAKELKKKCGSGGTIRERIIEIQGDHRDKLVELLTKKGYTTKKAGG
ncbi:MAG: translation initiation factor Sui1 [Chloroflexota bacterium]